MEDTQLPRYQVFLQEKPGEPHQDVGSVHAPDGEMALLNARDVFVRRPECTSLWVVPAGAIFSRTAQELAKEGVGKESGEGTGESQDMPAEVETYCVFSKSKPAGTHILNGEVQAASPHEALSQGIARYSTPKAPFSWWVFPARLITSSQPGDMDSMFLPAFDKPFRLSTDFHTHTAMRKIKDRKD
jgi:ring-1,2-phenylacetyl-CoA epoxidase subunit PaaB